jgi:iron(III) transport system substrate-binding protein
MEYLMTPAASEIWVKHHNEPIRPEVGPAKGTKSAREVKAIRPTLAEVSKGIPEVIKQWRDTFGV